MASGYAVVQVEPRMDKRVSKGTPWPSLGDLISSTETTPECERRCPLGKEGREIVPKCTGLG